MCINVQPESPTKTMQVGGVQSKVAKWVAMAEKACRMAASTQTKIGTAGTGHHWVATDFCFPFQEKKELTKLKTNPERNDLKPDFVLVPPKLFFFVLGNLKCICWKHETPQKYSNTSDLNVFLHAR